MKRLIALLLLISLGLNMPAVGHAEEKAEVRAIAVTPFNLRKEPASESAKICHVGKGQRVTVVDDSDENWWLVTRYQWTGYAKKEWLTPEPEAKPSKAQLLEEAGIRFAAVEPTGVAVGQGDPSEIRYTCHALANFTIREQPNDQARKVGSAEKGQHLRVLAYGDEWSHVQTANGRITGYAKSRLMYQFHSLNRFRWEVPGYSSYRLTGCAVMKADLHITESNDFYGGNNLVKGNPIFVRKNEDGSFQTMLFRDWVRIDGDLLDYTPLVDWRKAKAGDIIGGYTQFFGKSQGGVYYANRKRNLDVALKQIDGMELAPGQEFRYNRAIGPLTDSKGYVIGGVLGGKGNGIGGGVCHASTLMYQAVLSLPIFIAERKPHCKDGVNYAPIEFDAVVGAHADLRFFNTLPYPIRFHTYMDKLAGVMTVQIECTQTVDEATLASWDGSALDIPVK